VFATESTRITAPAADEFPDGSLAEFTVPDVRLVAFAAIAMAFVYAVPAILAAYATALVYAVPAAVSAVFAFVLAVIAASYAVLTEAAEAAAVVEVFDTESTRRVAPATVAFADGRRAALTVPEVRFVAFDAYVSVYVRRSEAELPPTVVALTEVSDAPLPEKAVELIALNTEVFPIAITEVLTVTPRT
jgi:hypothetical protein